ncbi:hypothetical protein [Micromonospora tulbaghiae]|uniref:hypothetical protein n=1 Tax=Micromonospora tulbaghiae TaxID=479978 RepID=UPI003EBEB61B
MKFVGIEGRQDRPLADVAPVRTVDALTSLTAGERVVSTGAVSAGRRCRIDPVVRSVPRQDAARSVFPQEGVGT